jgi:hypothetical protein
MAATRITVPLAIPAAPRRENEAAVATYRAACLRWPKAKITLRQGARVVVRNWRNGK